MVFHKKSSYLCAALAISASLFVQALFGAIEQTDTLDLLEKQLKKLDKRDLVVFDMDDVLIVPQDAILHAKAEKQRNAIAAHYSTHYTKHPRNHLESLVWKSAKTILVEPHVAALIQKLQKRGVKVIVLTAVKVGSFGLIEDTVAFRIEELRDKGIDLKHSFPHIAAITLNELEQDKGAPAFRHGVMLSHHIPKGKVLAAFLKKIKWKPRSLIFVDDRFANVTSVENELSKMGIKDLQCLHYTASDRHVKNIDPEIAHLQMRTLAEKGIWLSDQEASQLLSLAKAEAIAH